MKNELKKTALSLFFPGGSGFSGANSVITIPLFVLHAHLLDNTVTLNYQLPPLEGPVGGMVKGEVP